jgi:hypothetical protein
MFTLNINEILYDLNEIGWTGCTLLIDGTNEPPDSSSGGYNGLAALGVLTSAAKLWTATTS